MNTKLITTRFIPSLQMIVISLLLLGSTTSLYAADVFINFNNLSVGQHSSIKNNNFVFEPTWNTSLVVRDGDSSRGMHVRYGDTLKIREQNNQVFSLKQFDYTSVWRATSGVVNIVGIQANGNRLRSSFSYNGNNRNYQNKAVNWNNLKSVEMAFDNGTALLDNFRFTTGATQNTGVENLTTWKAINGMQVTSLQAGKYKLGQAGNRSWPILEKNLPVIPAGATLRLRFSAQSNPAGAELRISPWQLASSGGGHIHIGNTNTSYDRTYTNNTGRALNNVQLKFFLADVTGSSSWQNVIVENMRIETNGGSTGNTNLKPQARLSVSPLSGNAPVTVTANASASSDPDGSIVNYAWKFGDGATATGVNTSHRYNSAGNYTITLTVTDDDGAKSSTSRQVSVTNPANTNQPPVAVINATPAQGQAPVTVSVNANNAYDPDGSIVNYAWKFGDGATANGVSTSHKYNSPGNYTITLTVTDNAGKKSSATTRINVRSESTSGSVSIMALGDSITQSNASHQSYRYPLWKKLLDRGIDVDLVGSQTSNNGGNPNWPNYLGKTFDRNHQGHWGQRADQVLNVLRSKNHSPDIVLLHLGTNDEIQGQSVNSTVQDLRNIVANLRSKNPQVVVLLAKLIPYYSTQQPALNNRLSALAQSLNTGSSPVVIVDQNSGFNVTRDTFDRVHPNASGEAKMAQKWFQAILPFVN